MALGAGLLAALPAAFGIAAYLIPIAVLTSGYAWSRRRTTLPS
jgi:hypothetical protein